MSDLGRLESVPVRKVWPKEDSDFSRWLSETENMEALAAAIGVQSLETERIEQYVGTFRADIAARDDTGRLVLIENQLEQSDHRHLGQVLTYLAGLDDSAVVVWINTNFREEHRAALEWLNRHVDENFDFFGIEIEAYRIGDSAVAPRFNVIERPNHFAKRNSREVAGYSSEFANFYERFWQKFSEYVEENGAGFSKGNPPKGQWYEVPIGRTALFIVVRASFQNKWVRVELYIATEVAKSTFAKLHDNAEKYQSLIREPLDWQLLEDQKASRIEISKSVENLSEEKSWPDLFGWMLNSVKDFKLAFADDAVKFDRQFNEELRLMEAE